MYIYQISDNCRYWTTKTPAQHWNGQTPLASALVDILKQNSVTPRPFWIVLEEDEEKVLKNLINRLVGMHVNLRNALLTLLSSFVTKQINIAGYKTRLRYVADSCPRPMEINNPGPEHLAFEILPN